VPALLGPLKEFSVVGMTNGSKLRRKFAKVALPREK
jgi:hypothetical protein